MNFSLPTLVHFFCIGANFSEFWDIEITLKSPTLGLFEESYVLFYVAMHYSANVFLLTTQVFIATGENRFSAKTRTPFG